MIQLNDVTKIYNQNIILSKLNYKFSKNGIYCIVGENGSGKSTLLSIIANMIPPTSGQVSVIEEYKIDKSLSFFSYIAYVPDSCPIYPFITGNEFIELIQSIRSTSKNSINYLINEFELTNHMNTKIEDLSLGTVKKIMLISALMTEAKVIILDEPTNGLDTQTLTKFKKILADEGKERLIIISCHDSVIQNDLKATKIYLESLQNYS